VHSTTDLLSQATFANTLFNLESKKLQWSELINAQCNSINHTSVTDVQSDLILNVDICDEVIEFELQTKLSALNKDITCRVKISDQWFNFKANAGYIDLYRYNKPGIHQKIIGYCVTMLPK
jgi:hypothetical protein